ncbi:MAG: phospholipase D-like domain-containing protein, partial [Deltaproteobacteria bacterium]
VASSAGKENRLTYLMYLSAVRFSERSVHLTNAYFVPDEDMMNALVDAAKRDVDVKIVLSGATDSALVFVAARSFYTRLLEAGVKLYERRDAILHAKTGVIDGLWSTVGSTNMDFWSFLRDNEVNAVIIGPEFARKMEALFKTDLDASEPVRLDEWKNRPWTERFMEWFVRYFAYWL